MLNIVGILGKLTQLVLKSTAASMERIKSDSIFFHKVGRLKIPSATQDSSKNYSCNPRCTIPQFYSKMVENWTQYKEFETCTGAKSGETIKCVEQIKFLEFKHAEEFFPNSFTYNVSQILAIDAAGRYYIYIYLFLYLYRLRELLTHH